MEVSKQLRDKVLNIISKNKDIDFHDIITHMKKEVSISGTKLTKMVDEILRWWEESGKILRMVDRRTQTGMYRMNENAKIAKDIVSEAISELGLQVPTELHEEAKYKKVKDLNPEQTLWMVGKEYFIISYSPYAHETAVFRSDRNGRPKSMSDVWATRGNEEPEGIAKMLAKHAKDFEIKENAMFNTVRKNGTKLGDWLGQSFFYHEGNVWMLKDGTATNEGPVANFRKKVNRGVIKALEPKFSEVEKEQR